MEDFTGYTYRFGVTFADRQLPRVELIQVIHQAIIHALEQEMVFGKLKPKDATVHHWLLSPQDGCCYHCGEGILELLDGLCEKCWQIKSVREAEPLGVLIGG